MERFGATKNGRKIAKSLKEMVGTRRLELLTSTVSCSLWVGNIQVTRFRGEDVAVVDCAYGC